MLIRKEIETYTVEQSSLLKNAVQVAFHNAQSRRKAKLWKKRAKKQAPVIPVSEMRLLKKKLKTETPWTPWGKEVSDG